MKGRPGLLLVALLCGACAVAPVRTRPALEEEGEVFVYVEPFPAEASRLSLRLSDLSAVREDGSAIPLTVELPTLTGKGVRRQRLLAFGPVPPGRYTAVAMTFAPASAEEDRKGPSPAASRPPTRVDLPYSVSRRSAMVLTLALDPRSVAGEPSGSGPEFSGSIPPKLAPGVIAVASSRDLNALTLFDKLSGRVSAVIPTGRSPAGLALERNGRRLYAALEGEDAVVAIDLLDGLVVNRLQLAGGDEPVEAALTQDGSSLLVVNSGSNSVSVLDPPSLTEVRRIPVGSGPQSILVDPNGRRAYVFDTLSDDISVLDVPTGAVAFTIPTDAAPVRGQLNRAGDELYVIHRSSPYLSVVDPRSRAVTRRVYVGTEATALKVDPRTDRIFVARRGAPPVDVYDPLSFLPIDFVPTGGEVGYMAVDVEGNNLYLVLPAEAEVRTVRLVTKKMAADTDVGGDPYWVTLVGER